MDRRQRPRRAGFTLIELLVVILIIAGLIAILVPTVFAAFRKAKEAQVAAEMNNLATALASFKNYYGDYPPSRVILCESGFGSLSAGFLAAPVGSSSGTVNTSPPDLPMADTTNSTDMTNQQLVNRTLLYLRKFWPRADFVGAGGTVAGTFNDFDGDGAKNPNAIVLSGSECLAFFLGGIPIRTNGVVTGLSGFNRAPTYPFVDPLTAANRTVPNYEFNNGRLIDQDGDHIPSYIDPININPGVRRPYAYFASYGSNAYDPNDDNGNGRNDPLNYELEEDGSTIVERGFSVGFPVFHNSSTAATLAISPAPNPYTSGPAASGNPSWINPNSFQLICAGQDGLWGIGGSYLQQGGGSGRLPILASGSDPGNINSDDSTNVRQRENDNITNFSGGRLD